jgi:hypothetical protein
MRNTSRGGERSALVARTPVIGGKKFSSGNTMAIMGPIHLAPSKCFMIGMMFFEDNRHKLCSCNQKLDNYGRLAHEFPRTGVRRPSRGGRTQTRLRSSQLSTENPANCCH